jgi:hypothetical protein
MTAERAFDFQREAGFMRCPHFHPSGHFPLHKVKIFFAIFYNLSESSYSLHFPFAV